MGPSLQQAPCCRTRGTDSRSSTRAKKRSYLRPPLWRERAFEDHREDGREAAPWGKLQFGQPRRIDDGIDGSQEDFDEEGDRGVLADEPLAAAFSQEPAEIALDHFPPPGLHHLEQVRCLALDVAQKRRPDLLGMPLHAG